MTDTHTERAAIRLFEAMLDIAEADRDIWIAEQTRDQPDVGKRLTAMRVADQVAAVRTGGAMTALDDDAVPDRIGAYRITERIGRGGMGSVYRGERASGDFAHVVAIKIIKPGLLSEALVERFERERQTLATLSHVNIAQLYDGGETKSGSPYIIMELVDGLPLLEWIASHDPPRTQRRRIFRDICSAVSFAHRSLIVHRDLTPSNVLVTRDGTVKLIDFGIAKPADNVEDTDKSGASIGSLSLTPGYAAPERSTSSDVTTAADIYSLGRLLEKLIVPTGKDLDLRAIIARATAVKPKDRYPTVDALSADVTAWGDGYPVLARGGGWRYRATRFAIRNQAITAISSIGMIGLLGALTLTLLAYQRATEARMAEATRFGELRKLANYMLFDLNEALRRVPGNTRSRAALAGQAQQYLSGLAASAPTDNALRTEIANGLIELARVQGSPLEPNLALIPAALKNLQAAEALLIGSDPHRSADPSTAAALAKARSYRALMELHGNTNATACEKLLVAAGRVLDRVAVAQRNTAWFDARRLYRRARLELFDLDERVPSLIADAQTIEAEITQWPADRQQSPDAIFDRGLAAYYQGIARYVSEQGDFGTASFQRADANFAAVEAMRAGDPSILYMRGWSQYLGSSAASSAGLPRISSTLAQNAHDVASRLLILDPRDDATIVLARSAAEILAQDLSNRGLHAQAIAAQADVIAREKARLIRDGGGLGYNLAFSEMILGTIGRAAGKRELACANWQSAEQRFARIETMGRLLAFQKVLLAGLRKNSAACANGAAIATLMPLR